MIFSFNIQSCLWVSQEPIKNKRLTYKEVIALFVEVQTDYNLKILDDMLHQTIINKHFKGKEQVFA